jgi:hypothetical protein
VRRGEVVVRLGTENLVARSTQPLFGYCRSGYHLFKLIRRFLFGTSPFFLQSSTAHPSADCGFSENSITRFPFLFLSGATPLFPRTANWVVGVSTHWYWANEIPVVEHRGIKSLLAAGDVPAHLDQIIRNRAVYPLNRGGLGKGSVVKTARNFPTENCQRIRIVIGFILVFQSGAQRTAATSAEPAVIWKLAE